MNNFVIPYNFYVRYTDSNGKIIIISIQKTEKLEECKLSSSDAFSKSEYAISTTMDETKHFNIVTKNKEKFEKSFGYMEDYMFNGFKVGGTYNKKLIVGRLLGQFSLTDLKKIESLSKNNCMLRLYNDLQDKTCSIRNLKELNFKHDGLEFDHCEIGKEIYRIIENEKICSISEFDDSHLKRIRKLR